MRTSSLALRDLRTLTASIMAAATLLSISLTPLAARAQEAGQNPKIWFNTINERIWPFEYTCEDALQSPITVTGGGSDQEPSGRIEQYSVLFDWGDGTVESANATFTPPSGQGGFTMTYSVGAHAYATGGKKTMTVTLYHSQLAGEDNKKIGSSSATICIAPEDADKDGIDDQWEKDHGLDPADPSDAAKDADNDGVYNLDEYEKGGDPARADTDGDGMPDKWEFDNGLDLAVNDAALDPDNDGRDNAAEFKDDTDPQKADEAASWMQKNGLTLAALALVAVLAGFLLMRKPAPKKV